MCQLHKSHNQLLSAAHSESHTNQAPYILFPSPQALFPNQAKVGWISSEEEKKLFPANTVLLHNDKEIVKSPTNLTDALYRDVPVIKNLLGKRPTSFSGPPFTILYGNTVSILWFFEINSNQFLKGILCTMTE
jgi:hypothetical protein